MTAKILTSLGKVVPHITFRLLTPKEHTDPVEQDHMKAFLQMAEEWWGICLT